MAQKVFLSFRGTLRLMEEDEVSDDNFARGVFYFRCARVYAMEYDLEDIHEIGDIFPTDPERGQEACLRIRRALTTAEAERKRVAWRPHPGRNSQKQLSELLVANGARPLSHNLPPGYELSLIAAAVERVNNKDGQVLLEAVY